MKRLWVQMKAEFETKIEVLVSEFAALSYEEIVDSLEYLAEHYRRKTYDLEN